MPVVVVMVSIVSAITGPMVARAVVLGAIAASGAIIIATSAVMAVGPGATTIVTVMLTMAIATTCTAVVSSLATIWGESCVAFSKRSKHKRGR